MKKFSNITLYKKEQLIICSILLCFVLSGIGLPTLKEYPVPVLPENTLETPAPEKTDKESKDEKITGETSENAPTVDADAETPSPNPTQDSANSDVPANSDSPTSTPAQNPENSDDNSTPAAPTDTENPNTSTEPETQEKVWVPPVYEIIHHEAVYETRQVYICTGTINDNADTCNEVFATLEEWNTHKSINGG